MERFLFFVCAHERSFTFPLYTKLYFDVPLRREKGVVRTISRYNSFPSRLLRLDLSYQNYVILYKSYTDTLRSREIQVLV